jgi:hypothetical protein
MTWVSWRSDPLVRLLIEADGVTETALDGLLQRIAVVRAEHIQISDSLLKTGIS